MSEITVGEVYNSWTTTLRCAIDLRDWYARIINGNGRDENTYNNHQVGVARWCLEDMQGIVDACNAYYVVVRERGLALADYNDVNALWHRHVEIRTRFDDALEGKPIDIDP